MSRPTDSPDWATDVNYPSGVDPWNDQPNKVQPASGIIQEGFVPQNYLAAEYLNYLINNHGRWIDYLDSSANRLIFGSGSDGNCDFNASNTFSFASLGGGEYTLNRDIYTLNLTASFPVNTNGFRVYVNGTLTTVTSFGRLQCNGGDASGVTAGTGAPAGSLAGGKSGGAGKATNSAGDVGTSASASFNGNGGDGGGATGPSAAGGAGGVSTAPAASYGTPSAIGNQPGILIGTPASPALIAFSGGPGGGGGGGNGVTNSGGGGGGGGVLTVYARQVAFADVFSLRAYGGAGGNATGNSGNGGGGAGGTIVLVYSIGDSIVGSMSAANNCQGGSKGTGGLSGSNGQNGAIYKIGV